MKIASLSPEAQAATQEFGLDRGGVQFGTRSEAGENLVKPRQLWADGQNAAQSRFGTECAKMEPECAENAHEMALD